MKDVYSYPFPEVRDHLRKLNLAPEFMLNTLARKTAAGMLACYEFSPELELPESQDGSLQLDELHVPVIDRIVARNQNILPGINELAHRYPHHGSSQAMFTLMAEWKAQGTLSSIAVLEGEYEGYSAYAESLKIPIQTFKHLSDASYQNGQTWFVSNPSALDGNWIEDDTWNKFLQDGHDVVVDAAYVGLTKERPLDVSAPNIRAVLTSPSKIFGVFRYRNTGIAFTREPVAAMYGTKWFKDIPALLTTLSLYETFAPAELPNTYQPTQTTLCRRLSELVEVDVTPSDVLLLGNTSYQPKEPYNNYRRGNGYRFGLTKLFEDYEQYTKTIQLDTQESV